MAKNTKIEWADHTFNPWVGCTRVGPGCDNCYAESINSRFKGCNWGPGAPRRRTSPANWKNPIRWNNTPFFECQGCGWRGTKKDFQARVASGKHICQPQPARPRVFCASMADVFDNEVDPSWRADLFALIDATPNLDWLVLTKRIGNVQGMMKEVAQHLFWLENLESIRIPSNVWLGATVVNQAEADRDITKLLSIPAAVRWISAEPLLGPMHITPYIGGRAIRCACGFHDTEFDVVGGSRDEWCLNCGTNTETLPALDWVVVGGESGTNARPMHPGWARSIRDQCQAAGTAFLFKQWGSWGPFDRGLTNSQDTEKPGATDYPMQRFGTKLAGRALDGHTWDEYPERRCI